MLKLLCHNKSNAEIAETLGVKVCTVKTHVNRILAKLGAKRRSEARETAQRLGLFREE
ncbi:MAG: LuxR C-terminal-related transcriptional regulator [Clostridia bacterium]